MSKSVVVVAATSTESGRFHRAEKTVDLDTLLSLFDQLTAIGQGYLELRSATQEFPVLTVGFRDNHAVLHCLTSPAETSLLHAKNWAHVAGLTQARQARCPSLRLRSGRGGRLCHRWSASPRCRRTRGSAHRALSAGWAGAARRTATKESPVAPRWDDHSSPDRKVRFGGDEGT